MDFDLFVIGGGSAGVRCARVAAGHGARVGVAEERFWGGTCVNIGCVPKKLLVQAGEYGSWADDAAGFGWTVQKGPHDWAKLIAAKDRPHLQLDTVGSQIERRTVRRGRSARVRGEPGDRHAMRISSPLVARRPCRVHPA